MITYNHVGRKAHLCCTFYKQSFLQIVLRLLHLKVTACRFKLVNNNKDSQKRIRKLLASFKDGQNKSQKCAGYTLISEE